MVDVKRRLNAAALRFLAREPVTLRSDSPVVSFTFDDFPASALENGGKLLEDRGYRGTYYASFGLAGSDSPGGPIGSEEDLASCTQRGHELGCHTFSHAMCPELSESALLDELGRNQAIAARYGQQMTTFAYPFGAADLKSKQVCARHFRTARSIECGINRGREDASYLKSVPMFSNFGMDVCERHLRSVVANPGWLILFTHDVSDNPSRYGCSAADLKRVISMVQREGIQVLPVRAALDYLTRRR